MRQRMNIISYFFSLLCFFTFVSYIFVFLGCGFGGDQNCAENSDSMAKVRPEEVRMSGETLDKIAGEIEARIKGGYMTAAQVIVVREGKIVLEGAYGKMSRTQDAPPVSPDSPFLAASITKPVTAAAVMILVERGKVNLDDPVQKYIPEFAGEKRNVIVVRNLLNHTSGLPDMLPENAELRKKNTPLSGFIPLIYKTPLLFTPGTEVRYQSMGIALLGEIVERVTGTALRDFMKRELFDPLGMSNTFLGSGNRELSSLVACDVQEALGDPGFERWDWNSPYWRDFGAPWGGLHSTAADLAVFLQTFLCGGEYHGTRILSEAAVNTMTENQAEGLNSPWGLGWGFKNSLNWTYFGDEVAEETFGHCGATGTVAWADPTRQVLFVCLTTRPLKEHEGEMFNRLSDLVIEAIED